MRIFVGSYSIPSEWTGTPYGHGEGIVSVVPDRGDVDVSEVARREVNPSFLVAEPAASRLWAITEPEHGGDVVCFGVDAGVPTEVLRRVPTGRDAPCHLTVADDVVLVSHYHGGAVVVIGRDTEGLPAGVLATLETPVRGEGWDRSDLVARPHATLWIPGSDEFVVADCGRDTVLLYHWDRRARRAELRESVALPPETGPRHFAWHAGSNSILVSDQNSAAVTVIGWSAQAPRLQHRQTLVTAGLGRKRVIPSEIAVHPSGRLAVMANRWDDSLTLFDVASDGGITERGCVDSGGANPRHFAFSPDGSLLAAAHQESDELTLFTVSREALVLKGRVAVATPTCVIFWEPISDQRA